VRPTCATGGGVFFKGKIGGKIGQPDTGSRRTGGRRGRLHPAKNTLFSLTI